MINNINQMSKNLKVFAKLESEDDSLQHHLKTTLTVSTKLLEEYGEEFWVIATGELIGAMKDLAKREREKGNIKYEQ